MIRAWRNLGALACMLLACVGCGDDERGSEGGTGGIGGSGGVGGQSGIGGTGGNSGTGGIGGFGGTGGTGGTGMDSGAGGVGGMACEEKTVRANRVKPNVILIIDQSGSMSDSFGDAGSRWDVLRDFLLEEPGGLIADLQDRLRFGLALYTGSEDADMCPTINWVPPALDNYQPIADVYEPEEPEDDTPTGDAIQSVIERLDLEDPVGPDDERQPTVFLLATDGMPDRCEQLNPNPHDEAITEALDAVAHAYSLDVKTFILSVGPEVADDHQQAMANEGLGRGAGDPDAEYWEAGNDEALRDALQEIVGAQVSCDVELEGMVEPGRACELTVELNGEELACDGDDGWTLLDDARTVRIRGTACDTLKTSEEALLNITVPCDGPVIE